MNTTYQNDSLVISIPTATPEALQNQLSLAIINSLKHQLQSNEPMPQEVKEGNIYLLSLLKTMMPDERQLMLLNTIV